MLSLLPTRMSEVRPSEERLISSPLAQALHSSVFTAATTRFGQVKPETRERAEGPAALGVAAKLKEARDNA